MPVIARLNFGVGPTVTELFVETKETLTEFRAKNNDYNPIGTTSERLARLNSVNERGDVWTQEPYLQLYAVSPRNYI